MMSRYHFDYSQYEKQLSPFGKKVLQVLYSRWKRDDQQGPVQNRMSSVPASNDGHHPKPYLHRQDHQRKGISSSSRGLMNFHDSSDFEISTPIANFSNLFENVINETTDDRDKLKLHQNTTKLFPPVPTSNQLTTTVDECNLEKNLNVRTEDLTHSVSNPNNTFQKPNNAEFHEIKMIEEKPFFNFNVIEGFDCNKRQVGWDDMFDTEILDTAIVNTKNDINEPIKKDLFEISFPNGATSTNSKTGTKPQKVSKKPKTNLETKQTKRKIQTSVTDKIPKKVKKIPSDDTENAATSCFRKENYTTTVKNWLDTVEPNIIEKDSNNPKVLSKKIIKKSMKKNKQELEVVQNNKNEIQIEPKSKEKVVKKVVQSKLANKDGKMKFGKPTETPDSTSTGDGGQLDRTVSEVKSIVGDKKDTDKKGKPKFVAPIKSQLPVKDVSYNVITLDNANTELGVSSLFSMYEYDVIFVLTFSNGVCQLNNHYTEDKSNPDGVMINVDDSFYYLSNQNNFSDVFRHILKHNKILCYDGKQILMYMKTHVKIEIDFELTIIDSKIGGSLLDPDNPPENFSQLQKLLSSAATYTISTECSLQKCAWYITLLRQSSIRLIELLKEELLWNVFENIEMKLIPIITDMETQGVIVDVEKLKSLEALLVKKMKEVEDSCHKAAGKVFQINSTVQVRAIIYDELQLDARCNVRVRETITKGAKSTSEDMLRTLGSVHPLPSLVLQYRQLHKSYSTFIAGVAQHVSNSLIRPTWVQNAAATGRIACNNPNLQAIPKAPFNLGTIFGEHQEHVVLFRSIYLAPEGRVLLAADFQQVECRVWAHVAKDTAMTAALSKRDLFNALAADWLRKPESSITSEDRERTKRLVYASLYGAGQRKLADILQLTTHQTQQLMDTFHCTFPSLKSFSSEVVSRCAAEGRLVSTGGRRRLLPQITSEDQGARKHAERQAVNFIVQGSAADVCKMAMIESCAALRGCDARLLLQIHDELVFCVKKEHLHNAAVLVKQAMEGCGARCGLPLTLPVSLAVGDNWADMIPYQI